jgi:hypothetical protein
LLFGRRRQSGTPDKFDPPRSADDTGHYHM